MSLINALSILILFLIVLKDSKRDRIAVSCLRAKVRLSIGDRNAHYFTKKETITSNSS